MDAVIFDLVKRFDTGALSRRQLIQGLTVLAAAGGAAPLAAQETPFKSLSIDHISVQTPDLARSVEFYRTIFGGIVDHFAIAIEGFDRDAATKTLERLGLEPAQNLDYGFHVRDPAGVPVQIVGG